MRAAGISRVAASRSLRASLKNLQTVAERFDRCGPGRHSVGTFAEHVDQRVGGGRLVGHFALQKFLVRRHSAGSFSAPRFAARRASCARASCTRASCARASCARAHAGDAAIERGRGVGVDARALFQSQARVGLVALAHGGAQTDVGGLDFGALLVRWRLPLQQERFVGRAFFGLSDDGFEHGLGAPRELRDERETKSRAATGERVGQAMQRGQSLKLFRPGRQFQIMLPTGLDAAQFFVQTVAVGAPQNLELLG